MSARISTRKRSPAQEAVAAPRVTRGSATKKISDATAAEVVSQPKKRGKKIATNVETKTDVVFEFERIENHVKKTDAMEVEPAGVEQSAANNGAAKVSGSRKTNAAAVKKQANKGEENGEKKAEESTATNGIEAKAAEIGTNEKSAIKGRAGSRKKSVIQPQKPAEKQSEANDETKSAESNGETKTGELAINGKEIESKKESETDNNGAAKASGSRKRNAKQPKKQEPTDVDEAEEADDEEDSVIKSKAPAAKGVVNVPFDSSKHLKIVSWNVNGINSTIKSGNFEKYLKSEQADIIGIQETKWTKGVAPPAIVNQLGYEHVFWYPSEEKKGYAGTAILSKIKPISVIYGINAKEHDQEGRCITAEYDSFYFVCSYVPNSGQKLERLKYRGTWDQVMLNFLKELDKKKPVVWCGDLNVAHNEIDLARPFGNKKTPGWQPEERAGMTTVLSSGFIDSYRKLYPEEKDCYTFFSIRGGQKVKNVGWRLDYFIVSDRHFLSVADVQIRREIDGSDHVPLVLLLNRN